MLDGDPGDISKVDNRAPELDRIVDSDTTRIRLGRFFIFGATAAAASGFPVTIISSALGMALFAERDLIIGWAPLSDRFFLTEEGRGVGMVD